MPARCAPSCARCPRHEPTSSDAAGAGDAADTRKNRVDPRQGITMIDPDQCPAGQSATGKDHGKTGAANTLSYGDYLHLDSLLGATHPMSLAHHDIIVIAHNQTNQLSNQLR